MIKKINEKQGGFTCFITQINKVNPPSCGQKYCEFGFKKQKSFVMIVLL